MSLERVAAALIAMVLLATAAVAIRHAQRRLGTPVDVVCVFLAIWGAILLLFAVPVIDYAPTGFRSWLVIYGSILTTATGCVLATRRWKPELLRISEQQHVLRNTIDAGRLRLVWLATAVLGLVGFAAFVHAVHGVAGWQAVFSDPATVRDVKRDSLDFQGAYGFWKLLTYFNQIAFVLWTIGARMRAFTGAWRWVASFGWVSLVPFVFTADRNLMAAALVLACTLHLLWPWSGSWRRVALAVGVSIAVGAVGLTAIGNRYGGSLTDQPAVAAHVNWHVLDPVAIPYLYLTANIPTFGQLTQDDLAPLTGGQMIALPAVKAAARAGLVDTAPVETGVFYPIPFEAFSNYSWLGVFWLDFRALGTLLLPLLVGFIATSARLGLASRPSFLRLWTAAILLYAVAYSPLSNVLYVSLTWQYLLLGPVMALALAPGLTSRALAVVRAHARTAVACGTAMLLLAAGMAYVAQTRTPSPRDLSAVAELHDAVEKAHAVYARDGRYPAAHPLATRLGVNRPEVAFHGQRSYSDPLPSPGVVAVYTLPDEVFLRVRAADGRVYEVHHDEADGGATYGPGTRDR